MYVKKWVSVVLLFAAYATMASARQLPSGLKPPKSASARPVSVEFITPGELKSKLASGESVYVVDLRGPGTYAQAKQTIQGAVHTKVRRVVHRLKAVPRDTEIVTYCACPDDEAAIIGAKSLLANDFKRVRVLKGGWNAWLQAGGQLKPRPR